MTYLSVSGDFSIFKYLKGVKKFISVSVTGKPHGTLPQPEQNFLSERIHLPKVEGGGVGRGELDHNLANGDILYKLYCFRGFSPTQVFSPSR